MFYTDIEINNVLKIVSVLRPEYLEKVYSFYNEFTKNREVTKTIIKYSLDYNIPVNLVFALAWKESRFDTKNVFMNKDSKGRVLSRDWGLFSLNDKERKKWTKADFFNVDKNTKEALDYFSWAYKKYGPNVATVMFNSGSSRILAKKDLPYTTFAHNFEIRDYELSLDKKFSSIVLPQFKFQFDKDGNLTGME
jgi:hypothetical protein